MPRTKIFFVETPSEMQRKVLCHWVERFHEEGRKVQVMVDSTMAAQHVDQLLWTFAQESFIPHRLVTPRTPAPFIEPVVITVGEIWLEGFDVLVCDGGASLEFMERYPAALHFVLRDDAERKQESRIMWQKARDRGFMPEHFPFSTGPK